MAIEACCMLRFLSDYSFINRLFLDSCLNVHISINFGIKLRTRLLFDIASIKIQSSVCPCDLSSCDKN